MSARGTANGKLLLFGEHSVVYGAPALGFPLSRGVVAHLSPGTGRTHIILADGLTPPAANEAATPDELVHRALGPLAPHTDVDLHLDVPPMCGFGTSAAVAVALLRAQTGADRTEPMKLWQQALRVEHAAHARPSGVDPAIVVWDDLISYERTPESLPTVQPIATQLSMYFLIGWCGHHGGARVAVTNLSSLRTHHPKLVQAAMETLGEAARAGTRAIQGSDRCALGLAINLAHGGLSGLGLVGDAVEHAVRTARRLGAIGAKMSGAGGQGGAWFALFSSLSAAENAAHHFLGLGQPTWIEHLPPTPSNEVAPRASPEALLE